VSDGPYITRVSAWAPGIESSDDWDQWAQGKKDIASGGNSQGTQVPAITFTDAMFRRRLSQISKMTIQVVHDLLPVKENTKIFFISFRGELARQYQINKMLIEEKSLMPAAFSLSVFNAPAALASMALGLKGGYTALYPGNNSFAAGLAATEAALFPNTEELVLVYADEQAPPEYSRLLVENPDCLAFGLLLTQVPQPGGIPLSSLNEGKDSPSEFLRLLLRKIHVTP
jgi:hypothetical protein